jgi:hypothetical protein
VKDLDDDQPSRNERIDSMLVKRTDLLNWFVKWVSRVNSVFK